MVELGATEVLLARSRFGAAADQIEAAGYGDPLTVEVVADAASPGGIALSRVGIERSLRQPRAMGGRLARDGAAFTLVPLDGAPPLVVFPLDRLASAPLDPAVDRWLVGAVYRDRRFVLPDESQGAIGSNDSIDVA